MSSSSQLTEIIINTIKNVGPITFAKFMDMALYYPDLGYYTSPITKIGREGDFYTSSEIHPLFAKMIARQVVQMWGILGKPASWQIVEFGAGKGILAREILIEIQDKYPSCFSALTYWIIEISPSFIEKQQEVLSDLNLPEGKICWADEPEQVSSKMINGCIFSNELIDAFPVHRVYQKDNELKEIYITCRDNKLYEQKGTLSSPLIYDYFVEQEIKLLPGQIAEVNLRAIEWLRKQACCLNRGFIITIDYGLTAEHLYSEARFNGTLRCFRKHILNDNPYKYIGEQDITASVNFTALKLWGEKVGLHSEDLISQADFLINMGILDKLKDQDSYTFNERKLHDTLAIKQLIMPEGMGRYFKVLIQYKGLHDKPDLQGLKKKLYF